jgi:hypothetical protein
MKPSIVRRVGAGFAGLCLLCLASSANAAPADKKDVLKQAHDSYYSLKSQGLADFQCNMTPNWDALLADTRKTDPQAADRAIGTLKQLQFTVSLGTTGSAKVTHTTVTPENADMAKGLDQIYGGMEQMVSGFFDTWSPFMITSPFPDTDTVYDLADQGDQWSLSYKEGANTDVVTTMSKKLVIRELTVTTPQFFSTIRPQFSNNAQGLLLAGYDADYRGQTPSENTRLKVAIAYQTVNGFQLPQTLKLSGTYGGAAFQVEVTFYGCQARRQ